MLKSLKNSVSKKYKRLTSREKEILLGQGEAERKRLAMQADNYAKQKIEAWIKVNERYAQAIENYKGAWVPHLVMGANGKEGVNGAQTLIDLFTAKTANDLGVNMNIKGSGSSK